MLRLLPLILSVGWALAAYDPILRKSDGLRYEYMPDSDGVPQLVDTWYKLSDFAEEVRYNPDRQNEYHLFTRRNPSRSQPLVHGNQGTLTSSHFDGRRRVVFLVHGYMGSASAACNRALLPAVLAAEDANVVVVDWRFGAGTSTPSFNNALASGRSVARFINWLNSAAGVSFNNVVIIGFSLGGQQAGMIGRYTNQRVSYISALDPPRRGHSFEFRATDGAYTEVINTNVNHMGNAAIGRVNFYPNGGDNNPGCGTNNNCNHARAFSFMAESIRSGGFTGIQCQNLQQALNRNCNQAGRLNMGGLRAKTGRSGIFFLTTNASSPFSRG